MEDFDKEKDNVLSETETSTSRQETSKASGKNTAVSVPLENATHTAQFATEPKSTSGSVESGSHIHAIPETSDAKPPPLPRPRGDSTTTAEQQHAQESSLDDQQGTTETGTSPVPQLPSRGGGEAAAEGDDSPQPLILAAVRVDTDREIPTRQSNVAVGPTPGVSAVAAAMAPRPRTFLGRQETTALPKNDANNVTSTTATMQAPLEPGVDDVLLGRGKGNKDHPGNKRLQLLAVIHQEMYEQAGRDEKTAITWDIVRITKASGGRFLKEDKLRSTWGQVPDRIARDKVSHAMRDCRGKELCEFDPEANEVKRLLPLLSNRVRETAEKIVALHDLITYHVSGEEEVTNRRQQSLVAASSSVSLPVGVETNEEGQNTSRASETEASAVLPSTKRRKES